MAEGNELFKLIPRRTLYSRTVWGLYLLTGVIVLPFMPPLWVISLAQVALFALLDAPRYSKRLSAYLDRPRVEALRITGRLLEA